MIRPGIIGGYPRSARNSVGTYFDASGTMQEALPTVLRPNYVYQNGVWVRSGWLKEGAATNNPSSFNASMDAMRINNETCVAITKTFNRFGFSCNLNPSGSQNNPVQVSGSYNQYINSLFVYCADFSLIDVQNGGKDAPYVTITNQVRRYYTNGYFQPVYLNLASTSTYIEVYGAMAETAGTTGLPTSWIPYGQTRQAD